MDQWTQINLKKYFLASIVQEVPLLLKKTIILVKSTGAYRTVKEEPQVSHYETHLKGNYPSLGIVPINDDNMCTWGCIDVDQYPLDHKKNYHRHQKKRITANCLSVKITWRSHFFIFKNTCTCSNISKSIKKIYLQTLGFAGTENISLKQTKTYWC